MARLCHFAAFADEKAERVIEKRQKNMARLLQS